VATTALYACSAVCIYLLLLFFEGGRGAKVVSLLNSDKIGTKSKFATAYIFILSIVQKILSLVTGDLISVYLFFISIFHTI
jgi:hypothetical protein